MHKFNGTTAHWKDWSLPFRRFLTSQLSKHCDYEWGRAPDETPLHGNVDVGETQTPSIKQEQPSLASSTATTPPANTTDTLRERINKIKTDIIDIQSQLHAVTLQLADVLESDSYDDDEKHTQIQQQMTSLKATQTKLTNTIRRKTESMKLIQSTIDKSILVANATRAAVTTTTVAKDKQTIHLEYETLREQEQGQQIIDRDGYALDILMIHLPANLQMRYKTIVQTTALWLALERDYGRD